MLNKSLPPLFTGDLVTSRRIIYQPSRFAVDNLLYLQETGSLSAIKPHTSSRKDLSSYLFFIVTSGSGNLTYNNQTYKMKAGDCAFIDCMKEYAQSSSADDLWSLKWAHFNGCNMAGIYGKYLERGGEPCFSLPDACLAINNIDLLIETASSSSYLRDMKINEHLSSLLSLIMEYSWNPEMARTNRIRSVSTTEVRKYIDSNYREEISLEAVAKQFNINKSYLLRIFKEDVGLTINNYILQQRMVKAKNELRFTGNTLDVIAENCGFKDANYFIRMFKKIEGITPGEYRKQW